MVLTALVLVPLMIFSSFAVDVGAWYARASKLQRATDSAALAGVVWLPDLTKATSVANAVLARNGITAGGSISVSVSQPAGSARQLKVTVTDSSVAQFLSKVVVKSKSISRSSTAEYYLPIPLGSPFNYIGTGNLNTGSPPAENLWLAVSGYCSAKENGDPRMARYDNAWSGSAYECSTSGGAFGQPDYDPNGYIYQIDMPASPPASVNVQVYDAAFKSSSPDSSLVSGANFNTVYVLRNTGNPFAPLGNAVLSTTTAAYNDSAYANQWKSVGTITNPCAGCTYYLQVYTTGTNNSAGSNSFALRAANNGTFSPCSGVVGSTNPNYSSSCVQIHGRTDMSLFASIAGTQSFYLADVGAEYQGKKMEIDLFDLGEGSSKVEILDPNGNPVNFDWSTECTNPPAAASGGCSGTNVNSLSPNVQPASQPYPRTASKFVFNDRQLTLTVQLPANYTASYGTKTWWRVRYTVGTSATDRTTWSASILGSPVHLVG